MPDYEHFNNAITKMSDTNLHSFVYSFIRSFVHSVCLVYILWMDKNLTCGVSFSFVNVKYTLH